MKLKMYFQTISNEPKLAHDDDKNAMANTGMLTPLNHCRYVINMASVEGVKCPSLYAGVFFFRRLLGVNTLGSLQDSKYFRI